ncbi:ribonuclease domain-containing protein [Morganella morganii]|uniref:ribonuclease domain-containing protein n=1 Tax=Morganella morganii TaxID=582 RepID=UPI0021CECA9A|nr:ribonuclease domain-containing protein [Morganella morganii]MCU6376503.1 ribonuclease [Morganella morganii]
MMKKYGTLVIVLIVAVSAWLAGLPGQFIDTRPSEPVPQQTAQARVVSYVQQHQRLPDYYVTKKAARNAGWQPSKGNLCEVMPGKAIGGDRFGNREKGLPDAPSRQWFEADINYNCGHRGSDRLLYSNDGLIYVTTDHYRSFQQAN